MASPPFCILRRGLQKKFPLSAAPDIGLCENFLDEHGREGEITVVIAPITVKDRGSDLSIGWACNHGRECHRRSCIYARGWR